MKSKMLFFFFTLLHSTCTAQKEDYNWMLGLRDWALQDSVFSLMNINFNESPATITQLFLSGDWGFGPASTVISSPEGDLVCYSNGTDIRNKNHEVIINGADFIEGNTAYSGSSRVQGALILPLPGADSMYYFISGDRVTFYNSNGVISSGFSPLHYSIVDFANSDQGEVTEKETSIITDTVRAELIVACRHGNGRDWWLINNIYESNQFHRLLLSPEGLSAEGLQTVGNPIDPGLPQASFSPDGAWYAQYNWSGVIGNSTDVNIDIYQFDRCTGLLSNHIQIKDIAVGVPGGVSFSPNSRYLYTSAWDKIYQFDLQAADIPASRDTVAEYDGFIDVNGGGGGLPYATRFFIMQNTPDGKIYISCPNTPTRYLHVIDQPDSAGVACNVLQHHIHLPSYNWYTVTNFPHFRLGKLQGSPCDTLLQLLPPLAGFGCAPDNVNALLYSFADTSSNNPTSWLWDFGDGSSSADSNPVHLFPGNGLYEVCLSVSNAAGTDSVCKTIMIQTTGLVDFNDTDGLQLFPNPAREEVQVRWAGGSLSKADTWRAYNAAGVGIAQGDLEQGQLSVRGWPVGFYVLEIWFSGGGMGMGKLVVGR
jgi:PKD repeat protein